MAEVEEICVQITAALIDNADAVRYGIFLPRILHMNVDSAILEQIGADGSHTRITEAVKSHCMIIHQPVYFNVDVL